MLQCFRDFFLKCLRSSLQNLTNTVRINTSMMCSDIFFNFLRAEFKEIRKVKIILLVATDRLLIFLDHSAGASYGLLTERQEVLEIEADFWLFE